MSRFSLVGLSASSLLAIACGTTQAADISVPTQFPNIQAAINAAQPGDRILIQPGTYVERVSLSGVSGITLAGAGASADSVVLTGTGGSIILVQNSQGVRIENLTVSGGVAAGRYTTCNGGGGINNAGGGIASLDSELTLDGVAVRDNRGDFGGGLFVINTLLVVRNSIFSGNVTPVNGAAINSLNCPTFTPLPLLIENTTFENNRQTAGFGIIYLPSGESTIRGCTFRNNVGEDVFPGGQTASTVLVEDSTFSGGRASNSSLNFAGVVSNSSVTLRNLTIDDSQAILINNFESNVELTDITITRSVADNAIIIQNDANSSLLVDRVSVTGGVGTGAFINLSESTVTVTNSIFANNGGIGLFVTTSANPGVARLNNLTVVNNANFGVQAIAFLFGEGTLTNSIVAGNGLGQIDAPLLPTSQFAVINSIVEGGYNGRNQSNILTGAPIFEDAAAGNYELALTSIGIDAGDNSLIPFGTEAFDFAGRARLSDIDSVPDTGTGIGPIVDLGALERQGGTPGPTCEYDFNRDENIDLTDAQQMAQVFVGLLTADPAWLDGDLNGDENADLTDAQILASFVVTGVCPF